MILHVFYKSGITVSRTIKNREEYIDALKLMDFHINTRIPGIEFMELSGNSGLCATTTIEELVK